MVKRVVDSKRKRPLALDLFAGCGGLSLGFRTAGFDIVGGLEIDGIAAATHGQNFHPGKKGHGEPISVSLEPAEALKRLGHDRRRTIDVLIGGPPCQAFARVGRAKLRAESARQARHGDDRAWLEDPRVGLYERYLAYVRTLKPRALLMENVPDVLNHGGINVAEDICDALEELGYTCSYTLLNAAHYGVPQMRERMFLVAFRQDLNIETIRWPAPTHAHELPRGYGGTRSCALRTIKATQDNLYVKPRYVDPPRPSNGLPPAVTAEEALADLPAIHAIELLENEEIRRGARPLHHRVIYPSEPARPYARLMREWPHFRTSRRNQAAAVTGHEIRYLPRDYRIFRRMAPGDQYPQAHQRALQMFKQELDKRSPGLAPDSPRYKALKDTFVPPYDPNKFPNKWRKMEPDAPARTLMAHLGKDSYSHIHYDSQQARTISVREAARLQSFPDGFEFCGSMNAGFRQIGNAVPPLLAYALARKICKQLGHRRPPDFRKRTKPEKARTSN